MNWYMQALKGYSDFEGRSQRKEYWIFWLSNTVIGIVLGLIELSVGSDPASRFGPLTGIFTIFIIVPGIAVAIRRLHDIGKSGWWLLLTFIPLIGLIPFVFMMFDSQTGVNEYGEDPKSVNKV